MEYILNDFFLSPLKQDDEIKKYVKQILDGANLEEITMKTVCKQVYGRYPDHDLTHKKDLIKTTVKSVSHFVIYILFNVFKIFFILKITNIFNQR